jgi:hypothetical protein
MKGLGKGYKEAFARFFEAPTREGLRDLLRDGLGEANEFDFKQEWPETSKLAKHILGFANFDTGGCIVVGVKQEEDGSLNPVGVSRVKDKTEIFGGVDDYLPDALSRQIELLDFLYEESEYPKLKGKSFQVLFVEDDPVHIPFLSMKAGANIVANRVYTRHGVATEEATHDEVQRIINRRLETGYSSRKELDLRTHLEQLKVLFEQVSPYAYRSVFGDMVSRTGIAAAMMKRVPNRNYPEEDYETFMARAIARKKRRIEMELDIEDISTTGVQ